MNEYQSNKIHNNHQLNTKEDHHHQMAASYTEIAFQSSSRNNQEEEEEEEANDDHDDDGDNENDDKSNKDNLIERFNQMNNDEYNSNHVNDIKPQKRPVTLLCEKSFPYDLEGTVRREGDMTHFVAENLEYKIKLSSPIAKRDMSQPNFSSKNSTPSTSAGIIQKHFLQSQLAQIDSNVLTDIEIDAQYLAASVDNLTENLYNLLHSVSSITADNVEIHKNSVNKLTDSMDSNIKCMYTIMAKTEEISKSMKPTEQLALRIREIKRLVDMLENSL
ncbi:BLOC-1-related complex subunit 6 [Episyrphus balteatus]|uniref:BLOC-1-related complex subunit 6 n=1 Tax=Episyrphus balteatus TaxID=286459 RepID=UPI0024855445|nr:BLOC-1-related complex subunit 6 [Episyrphus balteatus]